METVFLSGNLLTLALLGAIVVLAYRALWQALVVVTPAGEQVVELFTDDDPSREFWLEPIDGNAQKSRRIGTGLTIGSASACELRAEGPSVAAKHIKLSPYRDWCAVEELESELTYVVDDQEMHGHSLLKEGQCLKVGDLSVRLVRRHI